MTQPRLLGGRYELDGVIGRGGMAEVYRARDLRLDRVVAIKTLRSDLARDPTFQARFRREAQSAASLNHPSVIAVYDTGEDLLEGNPVPFIVMEYVEGNTLRDVLREEGPLSPERAMEMVDGILRALDYSHRGGIVHRDIKPANVMVTTSGEVKVMDFGIARALADSAATMTATAQVIGTAQYLSPEQARGERVDARSDLYSTGCVLYELLTGRPPFQGDSPVSIAYQHVREEAPPPSQLEPSIPQWADAVTMRALTKDANERYQSAADMRADIQRALQGMPVAAPTAVMNQGTQVMQGPPTQATRAQTGYDLPPVDYREPERSPGGGRKAALWVLAALLAVGAVVALFFLLSGPDKPQGDKATIPSTLVNSDEQSARSALQAAGFTNVKSKQQYSDKDKGTVLKVDPEQGKTVPKSTEITLTVSKGQQKVTVPSVRGMSEDEARDALEKRGFRVDTSEESSSGVPEDHAIRTDPAAGSKRPKGSTVTVFISKGPGQALVPNVEGKSVATARKMLRDAGFRVSVRSEEAQPGGPPPGTVISQSPSGGSTEDKGSTVTITVAKAPKPTEEPTPGESSPGFPIQPGGNG